jgi:hypothetical protein
MAEVLDVSTCRALASEERTMAGELLIRVIDYDKFKALVAKGATPEEAAGAVLDCGPWYSFPENHGPGWVFIDGSAFYEEMYALYEGHHEWPALLEDEESATLIVPNEVLAIWQDLLVRLPPQGMVRRKQPRVATALAGLVDMALREPQLRLTLCSLL